MISIPARLKFAATTLIATITVAAASDRSTQAPYAGQQSRAIKSLSPADIAAIEAGHGWGFAKPAELNGYPGPLHVLELDEQLGLTDVQRQQIKAVFEKMKASAIKAGAVFLAAERALDAAFTNGLATPKAIAGLTLASAKARAELQRVHLEAHLLTKTVLTKTQLHRYAVLRGYAGSKPPSGQASKGSHSGATKGSHSGH